MRAVILKKDHLEHDRAFELANRAYEMAARSLGEQHPAYAVALQNLGLCLSVLENDSISAADYFERARAVAGPHHPALAETFIGWESFITRPGRLRAQRNFSRKR